MMVVLYLALIIFSALWVHKDAKSFREKGVDITPGIWSTLVFLFWVIAFPVYVILRFSKYKKIATHNNSPLPPASKIHNWWIVILFIGIPFLIILFFLLRSLITASEMAHNAGVDTQTTVSTTVSNSPILKTYTNAKYGFSFQYPADLSVSPIKDASPGNKNTPFTFKVYDAKYTAPEGAVGQTVRAQLRNVQFTIYPYSSKMFSSLQNQYKDVPRAEHITNPTITIDTYKPVNRLIGPYFEEIFHNKTYIVMVFSVAHDELAIQILSTFRFAGGAGAAK